MGFRITTNMMMNTYRFNLGNSTKKFSDSALKVQTGRKFHSAAEDPAAAAQAWRVRRAMINNDSYLKNTKDTYSRFSMAWTAVDTARNKMSLGGIEAAIRGETDSTASGRQPLGQEMKDLAESIIQTINGAKYGEHFVFSGADGLNAPFTWSEDMKTLYYRGVNVNAGTVGRPLNSPEPTGWEKNSYGIPEPTAEQLENATEDEKAWAAYYKDQTDLKKLEKMSKETTYVDLGMGMKENEDGEVIKGTAFDTSLPGINILGYGMDKDGDPKNVVMIMKKIGDLLSRCDAESGEWENGSADQETADRLLRKLQDAVSELSNQHTSIDTKGKFLKSNQTRLEDQADVLQEERYNIEHVDEADAITELMYNYTVYNAALKIGTQLLSESLIDYMR